MAKYLEANSEEADAHYNYGLVMVAMGQSGKARERFSKAAELSPDDPMPLLSLGDLFMDDKKPAQALEQYQKAWTVAPNDPACLISVFQAKLDLGKTDEAAKTLLKMPTLENVDATYLTTGGMLLAKIDLDQEAMSLYKKAIEKDETFARAHVLLANALARAGNFAEAAQHFQRFIDLSPDSPDTEAAKKGLEICRAKAAQ